MHVRTFCTRAALTCGAYAVACYAAGCGTGVGDQRDRPTLASTILQADPDATFFESDRNDLFEEAQLVEATPIESVISGRISGARDVDVFDLGPIERGERVVVEMVTGSGLDGAIAVFDDQRSCKLVNDHRNVYLGVKEPFIDVVFERAGASCYVAVSATPGFSSSGDYALVATKFGVAVLPSRNPDVVLLNFEGGRGVRIGSRPAIDVPAFDATSISSRYAGSTAEMIDEVVAQVREDFSPYDIVVLSTSEGATADALTTVLYFGTFDEALLGVAEGVDEFNGTQGQDAIVFTDTFAAFEPLAPTPAEMSRALANVAAHEIGHLLGLVHTADPDGIMDVTASLSQLLGDQRFTRSPLHGDVFPLGNQDAVQSLADTLGGDVDLGRALARAVDPKAAPAKQTPGVRARSLTHLSTCTLAH